MRIPFAGPQYPNCPLKERIYSFNPFPFALGQHRVVNGTPNKALWVHLTDNFLA